MLVLGIDAAVSAGNVGVAVARWDGRSCVVHEVFAGAGSGRIFEGFVDRVLPLVAEEEHGLLALDAPLGWPRGLESIATADAGASVSPLLVRADPFLRRTDRIVHQSTGKLPLAVGADRIARTAAATLACLGELRMRSGRDLPLAWSPVVAGWGVVEVYPAATCTAHGVLLRPRDGAEAAIRAFVQRELAFAGPDMLHGANRHVLDACACVVAARDFLAGRALAPSPDDAELARREGWIWFQPPAGGAPVTARGDTST